MNFNHHFSSISVLIVMDQCQKLLIPRTNSYPFLAICIGMPAFLAFSMICHWILTAAKHQLVCTAVQSVYYPNPDVVSSTCTQNEMWQADKMTIVNKEHRPYEIPKDINFVLLR